MSLYFIINNFVFAFGMLGSIIFIIAAWLSFDAYRLRRDLFVLSRAVGLALCSIWYLIHALTLGNDILSYVGVVLFTVGILCILSSFLKKNELLMHAVIVIPSFSLMSVYAYSVFTLILFLIAYLAFRQWKREQNPTWIPFSISFLLLGLSTLSVSFISESNQTHPLFLLYLGLQLIGFGVLGYWVWQYMRLRIHESIVMISIGVTFILATVVTLAFSTILIGRVSAETARNLITDVKVLDFSITSLKGEALAKSQLIAGDTDVTSVVVKNNFSDLNQLAETFLQKYNLGFLTITDSEGNVLVRANALSRRGDNVANERAFEEASQKHPFVTIEESLVEGLSIRAAAPLLSKGNVVGTVIAGFPLDNAFVDRIKRVTGLEMFIYKNNISVSGTAFAMDGVKRLVGVELTDGAIISDVLTEGKTLTTNVQMYGEPFAASYSPLVNEDGKIIGMLSAAKHQQDIINIANATNRLTLVTVIIILLALFAPILMLAKRFSTEVA